MNKVCELGLDQDSINAITPYFDVLERIPKEY